MLNQFRRSLWGILTLIVFSCYLFSGEHFVLSFDGLGNIEFETSSPENISSPSPIQIPEKKIQKKPHNHIILAHLYVFNETSQDTITLAPLYTS